MKKIRIGIIGTNGLPGKYGGWEQLVNHLTINLRDQFEFLVYTSSYNTESGLTEYNGVQLKIIHLKANGIQSVIYDLLSLYHAGFNCDILFVCGTSGCIFMPFIKLFKRTIILNPDGLEWKRKKWSLPVKWFLKLSTKLGVRFSDIIVSDNKIIQEYILNEYNKNSILIEYGGDHVLRIPLSKEIATNFQIEKYKYAFKVCRIEPENNIDLILEAFKEKVNINLIIVGNWDFSNYGKELRKKYNHYPNLKLLNPIYEQTILDELRSNCSLYIHGHSVGGTNPSLVEAMNLGLCVIAYNVSYNVETTERSALYFGNKEDLIKILNDYEEDKIDIKAYQIKMNEIAKRRYRWDIITEKYAAIFMKKLK